MTSYTSHRFSSSALRTLFALLAIAACANAAKGQTTKLITLHDPAWSVQIDTATLSAKGELPSGVSIPISGGSLEFGGAIHLTNTCNTAQWDLPTAGLHIAASMKEGRLFF